MDLGDDGGRIEDGLEEVAPRKAIRHHRQIGTDGTPGRAGDVAFRAKGRRIELASTGEIGRAISGRGVGEFGEGPVLHHGTRSGNRLLLDRCLEPLRELRSLRLVRDLRECAFLEPLKEGLQEAVAVGEAPRVGEAREKERVSLWLPSRLCLGESLEIMEPVALVDRGGEALHRIGHCSGSLDPDEGPGEFALHLRRRVALHPFELGRDRGIAGKAGEFVDAQEGETIDTVRRWAQG